MRRTKRRSILFHCHVAPKGIYQKAYLAGRTGGQQLDFDDGSVDALAKDLETIGMDLAVALAPFEVLEDVPPERWLRSRVDPGVDANKWLHEELEKHKNILGFATISAKLHRIEEAIKTVEEYVAKGRLVGVKIASYDRYNYGITYNDPSLDSLYEYIEGLRVPILFHTGSSPWHAPALVDEVTKRHREIPLIMAHAGGSLYRQAARIVKQNPNCYLDLTSVFRESLRKIIPPSELVPMIDLLGSERFTYGCDWPWAHEHPYSPVESIREDLRALESLPISEEEKRNILGGTLERLIRLDD